MTTSTQNLYEHRQRILSESHGRGIPSHIQNIPVEGLEEYTYASQDPQALTAEVEESEEDRAALTKGVPPGTKINDTFNCLPTNKNGVLYPEFWKYYQMPWSTALSFDFRDPFNDLISIIWGPRGGGKTILAVTKSIIDGQMKGIPAISNVPFAWVAKDLYGYCYKIESKPFDQERFAYGDMALKFHRLVIDEGNYLADRLRSTSNKNLAMADILQQARKFRMCVDFCTINWMWIDPRVTGSLCDLLIKCKDLYYTPYGKRQKIKKGHRIAWDVEDQTGKVSGEQFSHICSGTFNARAMWNTYNTENFVDPREARKRLKAEEKKMFDEFGQEVTQKEWYAGLHAKLQRLSKVQMTWKAADLWDTLGIDDQGLRIKAGTYMRRHGAGRQENRYGATYDLSELVGGN